MDTAPAAGRSPLGAGLLLVFLTALISGCSTFVNLYAVHGTSSAAFVTARNGLVALLLVPIALVAAGGAAAPRRASDWGRLVAIGIIGGGIPFLLFFQGLQLASAAHGGLTASFFYRTLFLMAGVLGLVVLRERFHWRIVAAAALLLAGNFLLLALTSPVWTDGSAYVLAATALWAVEYTISKRTLRDLSSRTVALGRMGFGAIFLFGYLAVTGGLGGVAALTGAQWSWVGISAAFLLAFVLTWYTGLKRVDLTVATAVLVLGFPITWLLSVGFQGSPVTFGETLGALGILAGVAIACGATAFRALWQFLRSPIAGRVPA